MSSPIHSSRDWAWFVLMMRAGLRVGEVVDLRHIHLLEPAVSDPLGGLRGSMSFMLLGRRGGRAGHIYFGDSNQYAILI